MGSATIVWTKGEFYWEVLFNKRLAEVSTLSTRVKESVANCSRRLTKGWSRTDQNWPRTDQFKCLLKATDQKLTKNWSRNDQNLIKNWPKTDQELTKTDQFSVYLKRLTTATDQAKPASHRSRPEVRTQTVLGKLALQEIRRSKLRTRKQLINEEEILKRFSTTRTFVLRVHPMSSHPFIINKHNVVKGRSVRLTASCRRLHRVRPRPVSQAQCWDFRPTSTGSSCSFALRRRDDPERKKTT